MFVFRTPISFLRIQQSCFILVKKTLNDAIIIDLK